MASQKNQEKITTLRADADSLDEQEKLDKAAGELAETFIENPVLLERVLNTPGVMSVFQHQISSFQGPLPPPSMLADYDKIIPGSAERILAMTEHEQKSRTCSKDQALNGAISKDKRGQWMGFVITFAVLIIASVFAWKGNTLFAGTLIGLDLLGLAAVFVVGHKSDKNED